MPQQRVTVTLPAELVREARHLAADRGVSLSKYVAMLLEEQVAARRQYLPVLLPTSAAECRLQLL